MTSSEPDGAAILVTGVNGKTGRRLAARLRDAGHTVRAGSRHGAPPFDWERPQTWGPALAGMRAVYVAFQPDIAVPGALATVSAFFAAAVACGVRRIVFLSGRGEVEAEAAERALQISGADWTILRASWFCQNFSEGVFLEPILGGELALPVGPVGEPFVDAEDIADVAFAALTEPGHSSQLYELTGPRALTFAEATQQIAVAAGRDIVMIPVPSADYRAAMAEAGVPDGEADLVLYLFTTVLDGRNTPVADGVHRALGRPARDFGDYVRRTAAQGAWR